MSRFATPDLEEEILLDFLKEFASEDTAQYDLFRPSSMKDIVGLKGAPVVSGKAMSTLARDVKGQMLLKDLPRGSELAKWVAGSKLSKGERAAATMGLSEGAREALMALVSKRSPDRVPARVLKERLGKLLQDINAGAEARVAEGPRPTMSVQRGEKKPQPWMRERYTPGGRGALAVPPQEGPLPSFKGGKVRPKAVDIYEQRALQRELLKELQGRAGGAPLVPAAKDLFAEPSTGGTAKEVSDYLAGLSPKEQLGFIQDLKKKDQLAERPTRAPYIRRELPEQYEDFPKTKTQQAVEDLLGKFDEARGKVTIKPTELGAKADGPTMARWLKDKNEARAAYAAIDAQVGGDMALSNKLVAAIQERYPEITAQQLDTAMPRAMKKVYQGLANNREITAGHDVKPWELRRFSKKGHLLIGDTEVPLAQAIADANARHSDASYLEASGMPHRKPTGERIPRPPFMGEKLEGARQDARAAKRPPLVGPPREGAEINELDRPRLAKLKPTTDPAKAVPLDPHVKQVLGQRDLMKRIRESAADTDSAYATALAQSQTKGEPLPTKGGVRAELAEKKDVDLTSDFDTFSENEKAARIENATGRKAQKAAERELSPRVPEGVRVASELRAGQGGLPPSSLAQVRKMARLAKGRMPEQFGDVSLKGVERPIAEWSPELRQTVDRIMKLATRRDAGVTRELGRAAMGIAKGDPEATVGMAAHVQKILKMLVTKL